MKLVFLQRYIPIIPSNEGMCVLWHVHAEEVPLTCREMGNTKNKVQIRLYKSKILASNRHTNYTQDVPAEGHIKDAFSVFVKKP
jgi:hypothetical protein